MYREILDVFGERGHCKCWLENLKGEVCLMGAKNIIEHGQSGIVWNSSGKWNVTMDWDVYDPTGLEKFMERAGYASPWVANDVMDEEDLMALLNELALEEEVNDIEEEEEELTGELVMVS